MSKVLPFQKLNEVASYLRSLDKKYVLIYAHNGTGKTRLSMEFKNNGKKEKAGDTLYFNAYTEDLFSWDNDLESDTRRVLLMNKNSKFFSGIQEQDMENKIRPLLQRYSDFNFIIDYKYQKKNRGENNREEFWAVNFIREEIIDRRPENIEYIKVSRGEENIFIWCFFLAVAQLAIDKQEGYDWVKYIYIDDPISSLDDNNAIAVTSHLAQMIKHRENEITTIISSHHTLFYNVMWNELSKERTKFQPYFFAKEKDRTTYTLQYTKDTPFFHHIALLKELKRVAVTGTLYTYHFSLLRNILEKTATFHGFNNFSDCIKIGEDDPDGIVYARMINIMSHGNYSIFEPIEMMDENKEYFRKILNNFMDNYRFNSELFTDLDIKNNP